MRGNFDIWGKGIYYFSFFMISLGVILFHQRDVLYTYNWIILGCWSVTFAASVIYGLFHLPQSIKDTARRVLWEDRYILLAVTLFAGILRFTLLDRFPYNSLGDELRDAGLYALQIHNGQIKDFFGLGAYNGYGNFIPLVSYGFLRLMGNSILIYRLPAAIAGTAAIIMTYLVGRVYKDRVVGICAAVLLSVSVFHLHYSRVEFLIVLDSLLIGFILMSFKLAKRSYDGMFILGLVYGLSFHFYAGIRGAIGITATVLFVYLLREHRHHIKNVLIAGLVMAMGFFIGLGPTYNVMMPKSLQEFREGHTGVATPVYKVPSFVVLEPRAKVAYLVDLYRKSFLVYITEKTNDMHIDYHVPLLPMPLAAFFVLGTAVLIIGKRGGIFVALLFLFPLTNEVFVDHAGSDHRMLSIMPILAIVCALGITSAVAILRKEWRYALITVFLVTYSAYWVKFFYVARPSDTLYQFREGKDYPFQKILEAARTDPARTIYILNDPQDYTLPQYAEKRIFYLAHKQSEVLNQDTFVRMLTSARVGDSVSFYSLQQIEGLTDVVYELYPTECGPGSIWPRYDCPLDTLNRTYYYYKITPRPQ